MNYVDPRVQMEARSTDLSARLSFLSLAPQTGSFWAGALEQAINESYGDRFDATAMLSDSSYVGRLCLVNARHLVGLCVSHHHAKKNTVRYLHVDPTYRLIGVGATLLGNAVREVPDWPTFVEVPDCFLQTADGFLTKQDFRRVDDNLYALRPFRRGR